MNEIDGFKDMLCIIFYVNLNYHYSYDSETYKSIESAKTSLPYLESEIVDLRCTVEILCASRRIRMGVGKL